MKIAILVFVLMVPSSLCFAARDKGGIGPQTDFKNMPSEQVLAKLRNAGSLKVDVKGVQTYKEQLNSCNGKDKDLPSDVHREWDCTVILKANLIDPNVLLFDMEALFRGCGMYAVSSESDESFDGASCGLLGRIFYAIGNIPAAKAVWEQAPGCWVVDTPGHAVNGCMRYIVKSPLGVTARLSDLRGELETDSSFYKDSAADAYRNDPGRLIQMARVACDPRHNYDSLPPLIQNLRYGGEVAADAASCAFLTEHGASVDMALVRKQEVETADSRNAQEQQQGDDRADEAKGKDVRFNAVMDALQSMPGANDPNAVLNAGNRQAAAMRRIGDARANQPSVVAANTTPPLTTTATNSSGAAVDQSAQGQNGGDSGVSGTSGANGSTGSSNGNGAAYANPLPSSCVSTFWDPKYYNWLSFQNNCGQAIYLSFIFNSGKYGFSAMSLAPGAAGNTGQSQNEVNAQGGYKLAVCPAGFFPVDSSTGQAITQPNQDFSCKKQ